MQLSNHLEWTSTVSELILDCSKLQRASYFLLNKTFLFLFAFLQQQDSMTAKNRKAFASVDFDMELGGQFLFSDHDST